MAQSAVAELCTCQLTVTDDIRLCAACHRYFKGKREFTSVSKVIRTLLPADYSKIDPTVLEIARLRGVFIDNYFCEFLRDPESVVPLEQVEDMIAPEFPRDHAKNAAEVVERLTRLLAWWYLKGFKLKQVQEIVYSEKDGIAGTFDIATEEMILDLKCTAELNPNYELQLGSYLHMDSQQFPLREGAIIHVTKDKVRLVPFDAKRAKKRWVTCLDWYKCRQELVK